MTKKRLWQTLRLWTISSGCGRAEYLRKNKIFAHVGENCTVMDRRIPLYANLIKLGNNVHLASKVTFVTHDITHKMINAISDPADVKAVGKTQQDLMEQVGCIEIGNNVFVGTGTTILYDVRVGSNVIIGAGSLVTKDVPDNSVVAGVPARVITTLDQYVAKRANAQTYDEAIRPRRQTVGPALEKWCWEDFAKKR